MTKYTRCTENWESLMMDEAKRDPTALTQRPESVAIPISNAYLCYIFPRYFGDMRSQRNMTKESGLT
jgi:hypothetical protein